MQKTTLRVLVALLVVSCLLAGIGWRNAQAQSVGWGFPERLSSDAGEASEGFMVADQYGYIHLFWTESGFPDGRTIIQYSRFDGDTWSVPMDIFVGPINIPIGMLSPEIDQNGNLHLIWVLGNTGPVLMSSAPVSQAMTAQGWSKPSVIDIPAYRARLKIDTQDNFHILYTELYGDQPGVYHVASKDGGQTWSSPYKLDPDIPSNFVPNVLQFQLDDSDGLHVLWYYLDLGEPGGQGKWMRYAHSQDSGETWSQPITIDVAYETGDELRMPYPNMVVRGREIHVVWAGNSEVQREHRFSLNGGQSWSQTYRILGDLSGQALGDGLAVDGLGRIHFVGQIRYPQGLYHAMFENGNWSIPSMFYLIARNSEDPLGTRIHAHNVRAAVRNGNQLVVTFTTPPTGQQTVLYAMHLNLDDVPPQTPMPTPTPPSLPTPTPEPTVVLQVPTPNMSLVNAGLNTAPPPNNPSPTAIIWQGVLPTFVLLVGMAVYVAVRKRR